MQNSSSLNKGIALLLVGRDVEEGDSQGFEDEPLHEGTLPGEGHSSELTPIIRLEKELMLHSKGSQEKNEKEHEGEAIQKGELLRIG